MNAAPRPRSPFTGDGNGTPQAVARTGHNVGASKSHKADRYEAKWRASRPVGRVLC
jgi:hypothetical protein